MPSHRTAADDFSALTHFVAVGVGAYTSDDFRENSLRNPSTNVSQLVEALGSPLGCAIPTNQIHAVTDEHATKEHILKLLDGVVSSVSARDLVMFYFCGHALTDGREFYLCLPDTMLSDPGKAAISGTELQQVLATTDARGVLLILDCCYGGGFAEYAPEIFRRSSIGDFRLLFAASGATQQAWDLGDDGTAFTRHLVGVLRGQEVIASTEPGAVYLFDLLRHSSRMMEEEQKDHYPTLPKQNPQLVGFHNVDPLLFVLQSASLKKIELKTVRYSTAHVKLLFRRAAIVLLTLTVFTLALTYTICDHLEFIRNESGRLIVYRGHYAIHLGGLPRSVRALDWHGDQLIPEAELAADGGVLQGTLSHQPFEELPSRLLPKYRFLLPLYSGDSATAYEDLKDSFKGEWPPTDLLDLPDRAVTVAAWVLARNTKRNDKAFFEKVALSQHMQVSALAQVALASLDAFPSEDDMRSLDIRDLTYRAMLITEALNANCTENALNFLTRLIQVNGTYEDGYIVDALGRWRCKLSAHDVFEMAATRDSNSPLFLLDENLAMLGGSIDLEAYRSELTNAIQLQQSETKRAQLIRALTVLPTQGCEVGLFGSWLQDRDPTVYAVTVRLVAKSCPGAVSVFPGQISLTGDILPDLIHYNAVNAVQIHPLLQEKAMQSDLFIPGLLLSAGDSGDSRWVKEILPYLSSTSYLIRDAAFRSLAELGYHGDEPEKFAVSEKHPLVVADAIRWLWLKNKIQGRTAALEHLGNLPNNLILQIFDVLSAEEQQHLLRDVREAALPLKQHAACLLAVRLMSSDLPELLNTQDLDVQEAAYNCIPIRPDAGAVVADSVFSSSRPDSIEFRLNRRSELNDICNAEVGRVPPWAQKWRRQLCVASDPSLAVLSN